MSLHIVALVACYIIKVYGQEFCPENEVFVQCVDPCNTCEPRGYCPLYCTPGCDCIPGWTRIDNGQCFPKEICSFSGDMNDGESSVTDIEPRALVCQSRFQCISSCRQRGFRTGVCRGRQCQCIDKNDSGSDQRHHGCPNRYRCIVNCQQRGYRTGVCTGRNGLVCRCYAGDSGPQFDECSNTSCIRSCRRRRYRTGICRRGSCLCL